MHQRQTLLCYTQEGEFGKGSRFEVMNESSQHIQERQPHAALKRECNKLFLSESCGIDAAERHNDEQGPEGPLDKRKPACFVQKITDPGEK